MQIISSQLHLTWKWIHCPLKSFSICILLNFSDAFQFHQRHHCCSSHSLIPSSFNKSDHSIPNNIFSPYPLAFLNSTSPIESTDCVSTMTYPYSGKRPDYHPKVVTALPYYPLFCYEVSNLTSFFLLCGLFPFECTYILIVVGESKVVTCGSGTEGWIPNVRKSIKCTGSMFTPSLPEGMRYMERTIDGAPTKAFSRSIFTVTAGEDTGYFYISCK